MQTLSQNLKWTTIAPRAFFSERESAGLPATSILFNARKSVENSAYFLLFAYFFFFYRNKEEKVRIIL